MAESLCWLQSVKEEKITGCTGPPRDESNFTSQGVPIVASVFTSTQFLPLSCFVSFVACFNTMNTDPLASRRKERMVLSLFMFQLVVVSISPETGSQISGILPVTLSDTWISRKESSWFETK